MVVRTQSDGRVVTGLYIGTRNARRRFPKRILTIELQLDHVQICCALAPEFWRGCPEIRDQRLCDWLESSLFHGRSCRTPIPLLMSFQEVNVYKLQPLILQPRSSNHPANIVPGVSAAKTSEMRPQCGSAVCRLRNFIACPVNTAPSVRFPESLA
ncbi:MAG: hypothetical protein ACLQGT_03825 [Terracidiphilus sp.]